MLFDGISVKIRQTSIFSAKRSSGVAFVANFDKLDSILARFFETVATDLANCSSFTGLRKNQTS